MNSFILGPELLWESLAFRVQSNSVNIMQERKSSFENKEYSVV